MCECNAPPKPEVAYRVVAKFDGPVTQNPMILDLTHYSPWGSKAFRLESALIQATASPSAPLLRVGQNLYVHSTELGRSTCSMFGTNTAPGIGFSTFTGGSYLTVLDHPQKYECRHTLNKLDFTLTGSDGIPYLLQNGETAVIVINFFK